MNPESKRPISVEDLLRLKRAERPPAEFWTEFERQLRAKQLSALVAKRPWWQGVPRLFAGFSRYHVPLGATAILAVTFISFRTYQSAPARTGVRASTGSPANAMVAVSSPSSAAHQNQSETPDHLAVGHVVVERTDKEVASVAEDAAGTAASDSTSKTSRELSAMIPLLGTAGGLATISASDSAYHAGTSLTVAQDEMPAAVTRSFLTPARGFESRALPGRAAVEPLQQITPPSERSRAKLLTAMLSMTSSPEVPARPTDRAASKLSEERLYDQIHRFDARGTTLSMKF